MFSLHKRFYKVENNLQIIKMMSTLETRGSFKNLKEAFIYFLYYDIIFSFLKRVLFYIL